MGSDRTGYFCIICITFLYNQNNLKKTPISITDKKYYKIKVKVREKP